MKPMLLLGGALIGASFGMLAGAELVELPADGSGRRILPIGPAMVLAVLGSFAARYGWYRSAPKPPTTPEDRT